ncbi:sigma-70 family RNA polymerase sigma factor [Cupriavidus metallidurans]|uniref:sigma-70 family RNA polymerase sigma factor n=1 Tax=Cupriavidus TaxID=106589 RepID=UPI0002A1AABA|nr:MULTISPECIES: sigma-70 family RNA polymerase sigma factor [Cupriavidus]EKZ96582.1 RNA polymerase sigma I (sigma 19) factor [Cupriavidus sp. HMR-1]GMG89567.1 RNA polymerase sigma factor [Cupriavidus sp. TKC]HBD33413.1 RNA polymerase subunit sigma-24 [Cupriavidus sp.]HBO80960.1 RNA polymerase subunit sigma-24 [Cupriavidus sp.]
MASTRLRALGLYVHYQELVGTWTRRLSNRHEAEDLSQEAMLRVLEARVTPEQPRAYLHQTARNIAIDTFRKRDGHEHLPLDSIESIHAPSGNPEADLHAVQVVAGLERALAELPLKCRQVFIWQRLDGCSQQEIAERLNISKNMVEKYMIRAMRHLRDQLGQLSPQ